VASEESISKAVAVRVRVTIQDTDGQDEGELATLLDECAEADPYSEVDDPVEWQRELRRERDLE
jgi:hypothetical protein